MELFFFWLLCAIFSAILAAHKNRSAVGWFFVGLLFGPFGLLVAVMPEIRPEGQGAESTRACPFCAEEIQRAAIVCKHCGRDVPAST